MNILLPGFFSYARRLGYERRWIATILAIQLGSVLFEGIGVGMILPILELVNAGGRPVDAAAASPFMQWLSNAAVGLGVSVDLATLLSVAFVAILLRQAFSYWREVYTASVQYELMRRVRDTGFQRFLHAGLAYHDHVRAGDFVNELTTELNRGTGAMTSGAKLLGLMVLAIAYLVIVLTLSPSLTLVALAIFIFAIVFLLRIMRRVRQFGDQVTVANQEMSSFLVERLKSVRLVRLSGVEAAEQSALGRRTLEQRDRLIDLRRVLALLGVLVEPIVVAVSFVLLYFSVTTFALNFEIILLFFFILLRLMPVAREAVLVRQGYVSCLASIETIDARLTELARYQDPIGGSRRLEHLKDQIELRQVTFHYESGADEYSVPALRGINLIIPAAKMTAIVGPSGAGKSTLVDLLPRLREPQQGTILFDDILQTDFNTASLRQSISFAPQQPQIFNVTVAEHIRYGRPDASMNEVREAARLAQADAFISALPQGYDTRLGEDGGRLSGGQRQRLDLARALVRRAPILVLDEPTAHLDADAEALFRDALESIRTETRITIIIIGHRLSTVRLADQIAVVREGRITQTGRHDELMRKGGWYAVAFASQNAGAPTTAVAE